MNGGGKKPGQGAPIPIPPFEVDDAPWNDPGVQSHIASRIREACKDGSLCLKAVAVVAVPPEVDDGSNDCLIREKPPEGKPDLRGSTITFVISNECDPAEPDPSGSG